MTKRLSIALLALIALLLMGAVFAVPASFADDRITTTPCVGEGCAPLATIIPTCSAWPPPAGEKCHVPTIVYTLIAQTDVTPTPTDICVIIPHDGSAPYYCHDAVPTDVPYPTPTPEVVPTIAPTDTPEPGKCIAIVDTDDDIESTEGNSLYVRQAPYGNALGAVADGDTLTIESYWDYTDEYGNVSRWYGFYWLPELQGYSHGDYLVLSGDCSQLEPKEDTDGLIVGIHPIPGASREELVTFEQTLINAGIQSGSKPYHSVEYCLDSLAIGGVCVWRIPPDCPNDIGGDDPAASAYAFMSYRDPIIQNTFSAYIDSGRLFIELTNECAYDPYLSWWRDWMNAALDYAEAHHWPALALGSLGPGHGSYAMFQVWQDVLMRNHALGGLFAMHTYSPPEICGGDGSLARCDPWCSCRHRTNYDFVKVLGYDIDITITEVADGWGNTQVTSAVLQDYADWLAIVQNDAGLHSVFWWLLGYHPTWPLANLNGHMDEFSRRIIATMD